MAKSKPKKSAPAARAASTAAPAVRVVPLGDRVLLREITREDSTTASGIIIPESADSDRDTKKGVVVAVGEGKFADGKREPMSVKVGQTVLYSWGDVVTVDGAKYTLVRDGEIAAILN
jgi:chaperonin GroES